MSADLGSPNELRNGIASFVSLELVAETQMEGLECIHKVEMRSLPRGHAKASIPLREAQMVPHERLSRIARGRDRNAAVDQCFCAKDARVR